MFFKLFLLFTLVPLIELALLIKLSQFTGVAKTIAIVILTGILGAYLARREGLRTWSRIQQNISQGISPADEMVHGLLILIAGAVLITPGLLTDLLGFSLLVPPVRKWFKKRLLVYFQNRIVITRRDAGTQNYDYDIIDLPSERPTQPDK